MHRTGKATSATTTSTSCASTRRLEAQGFTAKTVGVEIEQMRGVWAQLQNRALEGAKEVNRVDNRSLETQRETALERAMG